MEDNDLTILSSVSWERKKWAFLIKEQLKMQSGAVANIGTTQPAAGENAEPTQTTGQQKIKRSIWAKIEKWKDGR